MGWFSDFISNPIGTIGETGQKVVDLTAEALKPAEAVGKWSIENPLEAAALGAGAYYGYGALSATAEGGAVALAPVSEAVAVPVTEIAGSGYTTLGTSNAGYGALEFGAGGPAVGGISTTSTVASAVSAKDILTGVNTGLNLATAGVKLAGLQQLSSAGKMNATQPTGNLGNLIGPSKIDTVEVQATTPQGPVMTPASQGTMNNQNLMIAAAAAVGLYLLWKYKGA